MDPEELIDLEAVRRRFPWVGLASIDQPGLSSRYREIMAEAHRDRMIVEAIDSARRSA
ncbi:hypothetical protein [Nonomuraea sp. B1E8]|uniref:hypothetical protein n=1 Tax=unclassified Nonomuraea TaxID=2593643 RepID=UPI00325EB923